MNLAHKLKHRIQIQKSVQTPNESGGYDKTYETLTTIWAGMNELTNLTSYAKYIRGEAITDKSPTHEFKVRKVAVQNLGRETSSAFSTGFKAMADLMPLKSDYFIFLQEGSTIKGRLFQIIDLSRDENYNEFLKFRAMEIEEKGTGFPE
jgi:hypothetical protein